MHGLITAGRRGRQQAQNREGLDSVAAFIVDRDYGASRRGLA
jgi:hypothetical protein